MSQWNRINYMHILLTGLFSFFLFKVTNEQKPKERKKNRCLTETYMSPNQPTTCMTYNPLSIILNSFLPPPHPSIPPTSFPFCKAASLTWEQRPSRPEAWGELYSWHAMPPGWKAGSGCQAWPADPESGTSARGGTHRNCCHHSGRWTAETWGGPGATHRTRFGPPLLRRPTPSICYKKSENKLYPWPVNLMWIWICKVTQQKNGLLKRRKEKNKKKAKKKQNKKQSNHPL